MSLRFHYVVPGDLLKKLEREAARLFDATSSSQKESMCDHFFNFCVTAHSIRDWVINSEGLKNKDLQNFHERCNKFQELAACRDIANANKHFALEENRNSVAKGAVVSRSSVLDVFEDANGRLFASEPRETIELSVVIDGRPPQESHQFSRLVINAWEEIFKEFGISFQSIYHSFHETSSNI